MIGITETDVYYALGLLRHAKSKRFDESANQIGFMLRFRLRIYRATGIRLFSRRTVARLLASEEKRHKAILGCWRFRVLG